MKPQLLIAAPALFGLALSPVHGQEENRFDLIVPPIIVLTKYEDTYQYDLNDKIGVRDVVTQTGHVTQTRFQEGAQTLHHNHPEEETIVVIEGQLKVVLADSEITIETGDVLNIEPYAEHHIEALEDTFVVEVFGPGRTMIK